MFCTGEKFKMIFNLVLRSARRNNKLLFRILLKNRITQNSVAHLTTPANNSSLEKLEITAQRQRPFLKQSKVQNLALNSKLTEEQKQVIELMK